MDINGVMPLPPRHQQQVARHCDIRCYREVAGGTEHAQGIPCLELIVQPVGNQAAADALDRNHGLVAVMGSAGQGIGAPVFPSVKVYHDGIKHAGGESGSAGHPDWPAPR
jgi:hypothetical protein